MRQKFEAFPNCSFYLQNYHMDSNGWWDIGYNFLIGGDGNVYEGRGWGVVGAHAGDSSVNSDSIGMIVAYFNQLATFRTTLTVQCLLHDMSHSAANYQISKTV